MTRHNERVQDAVHRWEAQKFPKILEMNMTMENVIRDWDQVIQTYTEADELEAVRVARAARSQTKEFHRTLKIFIEDQTKSERALMQSAVWVADLRELFEHHPLKARFVMWAMRRGMKTRIRRALRDRRKPR